jgi:hypothetical protein
MLLEDLREIGMMMIIGQQNRRDIEVIIRRVREN